MMNRQPAKSYEDLIVWQRAHELVLGVYRVTRDFPMEERYHLAAQLRDAAVSVPANIAEGFRRRTRADKSHFVTMGHGSLNEAHYFLRLTRDLEYADTAVLMSQADEVSRMLGAYGRALLRPPNS